MKALVDKDTCTGCGICSDTCPEAFELNDDSIAQVILDPIPEEHEQSVRDATDSCPVEAITLED